MAISGGYGGIFNFEFENILREDYNALLALLCFDPTFKAISKCDNIKVIVWREVTIIRSTGNLSVTLQGSYTPVALCKEYIEENLPCFVNLLDDNQLSNSIFSGSAKRDHDGHIVSTNTTPDFFEAIRNFKKRIIAFIKEWGKDSEPVFELLELKHETITFVRDFEVM